MRHENLMKRLWELKQRFPDIEEYLHKDPFVRAWFEHWARSGESVEEGLNNLIRKLIETKNHQQAKFQEHLKTYPAHVIPKTDNLK